MIIDNFKHDHKICHHITVVVMHLTVVFVVQWFGVRHLIKRLLIRLPANLVDSLN